MKFAFPARGAALGAVLAAGCLATPMHDARAAAFDGNWSVLVITERGDCDKGYRYEVAVGGGKMSFRGHEAVAMNGSVSPNGAVKVAVTGGGSRQAQGSGVLSASAGTGKWSGRSGNGECTGRWEAERR